MKYRCYAMPIHMYLSGRSDPAVTKFIFLFTAFDPPEWDRTLALSRKAKALGIQIVVMAREEDMVNGENFRKLSSPGLAWFGEEREHLKAVHKLIDNGLLCKVLTPNKKVSFSSSVLRTLLLTFLKCTNVLQYPMNTQKFKICGLNLQTTVSRCIYAFNRRHLKPNACNQTHV